MTKDRTSLNISFDINRGAPAIAAGEKLIHAGRAGHGVRWKAGASSLTSQLEVVDPPNQIAWTGRTMGITAIHIFRFEARDGRTLASSEESWEGLLPRLVKGWSRRTLEKGIEDVLTHLKAESERRAARP